MSTSRVSGHSAVLRQCPLVTQRGHRPSILPYDDVLGCHSARRATPMRRRNLLAGLVTATVTWPLLAHAQQPAMPVVGFLGTTSAGTQPYLAAFRQGLGETGYVEGQNVLIEYRWMEDQYNRLPELAADLISHHVNVIVTLFNAPAVRAAKAASCSMLLLCEPQKPRAVRSRLCSV